MIAINAALTSRAKSLEQTPVIAVLVTAIHESRLKTTARQGVHACNA
jgi:hypothetical protein